MNTRVRLRRGESAPAAPPEPTHLLEPPAIEAHSAAVASPVAFADAEPQDAVTQAQDALQAATAAREQAAHLVADAQEEAQRVLTEAQQQILELEHAAREADQEAAHWQAVADRNTAIVATTAEAETLTAARDRLTGEAQGLDAEVDRLVTRLQELGAAQNEAAQRRAVAVRNDDADALRGALTELATAAELAQARAADLTAARVRLTAVRAEQEELCDALGRVSLRLLALRRDEAGLPPAEEALSVAMALLPALVVSMMQSEPEKLSAIMLGAVSEEQRPAMAEAIRLGGSNPRGMISLAATAAGTVIGAQVLGAVEQLAHDDPEQYQAVKALAFADAPPEPTPAQRAYNDGVDMIQAALTAGDAR